MQALKSKTTVQYLPIGEINLNPTNPRSITDDKFRKLVESIKSFPEMLELRPIVLNAQNMVLGGNKRFEACIAAGLSEVPVMLAQNLSPEQEKEFVVKDNLGYGEWNYELLAAQYESSILDEWGMDLPLGFGLSDTLPSDTEVAKQSLQEKFIVPPFSILDTRQQYWLERRNKWLALGIESEVGRGENLAFGKSAQNAETYELRNEMRKITGKDPSWDEIEAEAKKRGITWSDGTSIFDPVLCEIAYRWFCPEGATVLDPFAGGSVRGIVAA